MSRIVGLETLCSPALLFDTEAIDRNLERLLATVGGNPQRLRPHIKTHKCREILERQLALGIESVKCATLSEARLAAQAGVPDILIAYPMVGPSLSRLRELTLEFTKSRFSILIDHPDAWSRFTRAGIENCDVFLDLDIGMHRTGIAKDRGALSLYREMAATQPNKVRGIHAYDGHIHEPDLEKRTEAFVLAMHQLDTCIDELESSGLEVKSLVSGGSPTFALHARRSESSGRPWQCSPGTPLLWDAGYTENFPDLIFDCAALLLTRVISHPSDRLLCLDLGHKAVSAENPIDRRLRLPELQSPTFLSQSEEHLVVALCDEQSQDDFPIGKELIAIPYHVCPTVALHEQAHLLTDGAVENVTWRIAARQREW